MRLPSPEELDIFQNKCHEHFDNRTDFVEMTEDDDSPPELSLDLKVEAFRARCRNHFSNLSEVVDVSDDEPELDGYLTPVSVASSPPKPLSSVHHLPLSSQRRDKEHSHRIRKHLITSKHALRYPRTRSQGLEGISLDARRKGFVACWKGQNSIQVSFEAYLRDYDPERSLSLTSDNIRRIKS